MIRRSVPGVGSILKPSRPTSCIIDDNTPAFPAADLAPDDPTFADAGALCDCQKGPPLGTPALDCRIVP